MILARLRSETRPHHDAVEAQLGLLDRIVSIKSYLLLLRQFWGYYEPIEKRLVDVTDWPAIGFNWNLRRKTHLLERDLASAGVTREEIETHRCTALPELKNVPQALGSMYVLEGATLGGQVITRHLSKLVDGPYPTAFFGSYGDKVGEMWKSFGAFLTRYSEVNGREDEIVKSAQSTFDTLGAWLANGEDRR